MVITHDEQASCRLLGCCCRWRRHCRCHRHCVATAAAPVRERYACACACRGLLACWPHHPAVSPRRPHRRCLLGAVCAPDRHTGACGVHVAHHKGRGAALHNHAGAIACLLLLLLLLRVTQRCASKRSAGMCAADSGPALPRCARLWLRGAAASRLHAGCPRSDLPCCRRTLWSESGPRVCRVQAHALPPLAVEQQLGSQPSATWH